MDFDSLYRRLDLSRPAEAEIDAIKDVFQNLMLQLGTIMPKQLGVFHEVGQEMSKQIDKARQSDIGEVFSGNGPVAKRLKEHIAIHDWLKTEIETMDPHRPSQNYGPRVQTRTMDLTDVLARKLDTFNFHPRQEENELHMLRTFLDSIRPEIAAQFFRTPSCQLSRDTNVQALESGIYGDPNESDNFIVLLRTHGERPQDMETLVICAPDGTNVWHYHPFEGNWYSSKLTHSFAGLYSDLTHEYEKAVAKASPMPREYDFDTEIARLAEQAGEIFDQEKWLPPRLYYANHRLIQTSGEVNRPVTGYERAQEDSLIVASVENVSLIFRDTKGDYASRVHHYVSNYPVMATSISPEDIKPEVKTALIQRAATLLAYCGIAISRQKENA